MLFVFIFAFAELNTLLADKCLNSTDLIKLAPASSTDKLVLFNLYNLAKPKYLRNTQRNFSRIRDMYNTRNMSLQPNWSYRLAPTINLAQLVASVINASLVATSGRSLCPEVKSSVISIEPWTFAVDIPRGKGTVPVAEDILPFNFGYCDVPHRGRKHDTVFQFFLNSADAAVWMCLLGTTMLVGYSVPIALEKDGTLHWSGDSAVLAAVAVLLTPGCAAQPKMAQHSLLFVMWMYASITFLTYYSGSLTSQIISPPVEAKMTKIEEIFENNYSLIHNPRTRVFLGRLIGSLLKGGTGKNETSLKVLHESVEMMQVLLNKSESTASLLSYLEKMAGGKKSATMSMWSVVIADINDVKYYIWLNQIKNRKCYIGQELAYPSQVYYVISPASLDGAGKMIRTFQTFMETGVYHLWRREFEGIWVSLRVQDRRRVKGKITILEETVKVRTLELDQKFSHIFELWGNCLGVCLAIFVGEIVGAHRLIGQIRAWVRRVKQRRHDAKRKVCIGKISSRVIIVASAFKIESTMSQETTLKPAIQITNVDPTKHLGAYVQHFMP